MPTTHPNDPIARWCVYGLIALALWAGVRQLERPAESANATPYTVIAATETPSLPTVAPLKADEAPTPEAAQTVPAAAGAPEAPMPVSFVDSPLPAPVWTPEELAAVPAPSGDYIANVGAQAAHSPRGDVDDPPPSQTGPILMPAVDDQPAYIVAPVGSDAAPAPALDPPIAVAVPAISAAQADVIGARTSDTCPAGQVFYPRTGCHTPGSGGAMPGAVGE